MMVSQFQEHESLPENPNFDALYCEEEYFDECGGGVVGLKEAEIEDLNEINKEHLDFLFEHDLFWDDDDELATLLSKEKVQAHLTCDVINSDACLKPMRNEAIKWMLKVIGYYGFNAQTVVLAVNYYDRFVGSACLQKDKPWMNQLVAVACLSIAAKAEETRVPLLIDLQVEEFKYLFEAKTIQRMELLVLSTLQWKMNPVSPISFFNNIARRFNFIKNVHWEFLRRCERIIISIITDCRLAHYLPSVIAAATMIYAVRETESLDALEYQNQLVTVLRTSKEKVDGCHELIVEAMDGKIRNPCSKKHKHELIPSSPSGVIDASCSSVDSWAVALSVSSSPVPLFKRSKAQDQHMRLAEQFVCYPS